MLRAEVVHISRQNVALYGGSVLDRAVRFAIENDLDADPDVLWANIAAAMIAPEPSHLVIAAIDDDDLVRGFIISGLILFHGTYGIFIESLEIDRDARDGREEAMRNGWSLICEWGRSRDAKFIRAWSMNEKLAKVFSRFGMEAKPYMLVQAELGGE
jgi:hypothetical protein